MNFINYLKSKELTNFNDVKEHLQNDLGLLVKEDTDYSTLYMLTYPRDKEDEYRQKMLTYSWLKECRGLILEKNTNKVLCHALNATRTVFDYDNPNDFKQVWDTKENISISICGTQMRVFYYDGKWIYGTQRCIDAKKSYWNSKFSFHSLLMNTLGESFDENSLNKNYCYVFVLQHPLNRIVVQYQSSSVICIMARDMSNIEQGYPEVPCGDIPNVKSVQYVDFDSWESLMSAINTQIPKEELPGGLNKEGWVLKYRTSSGELERMKFLSWDYRNAKKLRGNYMINNAMYHYLCLRRDNKIDEYLQYYPEEMKSLHVLENQLKDICKKIQTQYYLKHIKKSATDDKIMKVIKRMVYELHGMYLKSLVDGNVETIKVTQEVVMEYLLKKDVPYICYVINKINMSI